MKRITLRLLATSALVVSATPSLAQSSASTPTASLGAVPSVPPAGDTPPPTQAVTNVDDQAKPSDQQSVLGGDIVVTAQRRSQRVQDVGISMTAVDAPQLRALSLTTSVDIARLSPNVAVSGSYGGLMSQFTMRGVTQNDFNDHVESVIAVYVDDTYIAMQQGQMFSMFDLDRVEMLKGPQGTLFGRNATGGLVQYVTKRPTDHPEAYVDLTYGSYNQARIEGAVSGPLVAGINGRLSGLFERSDGYLKNYYPQQTFVPANLVSGLGRSPAPGAGADLGGVKGNAAVRGQITADIAPNLHFWAAGFYNKYIASSAPYQQSGSTVAILAANGVQTNTVFASPTETCEIIQVNACVASPYGPGSLTRPVPGASFYGYNDPDGNGFKTSTSYAFDDGSRSQTWGGSARLTANLGGVDVDWISDYKNYRKRFYFDLTAGPENTYFWIGKSRENTISQELRVSGKTDKLDWVGGLYFLRIDNTSIHGIGALPNSILSTNGIGYDLPRVANLMSYSYSAFGQAQYKILPNLSIIGGLRVSLERKRYSLNDYYTPTRLGSSDPFDWDFAGAVSLGSYSARSKETLYNWKTQIEWKPDRDLLIYAGVSQGAKAGSFNAGDASLFQNNGAAIPYKPERLTSYETGFKQSFLNRRAHFNVSAYYYDYHNYQATRWTGISSVVINANARFYGIEGSLGGELLPHLDIDLNAGYGRTKVLDVPVGNIVKDVETTFAPRWTLSGLIRYTIPTAVFGGEVALQANASYQSAVWQNLNNFDANRLNGYGLVDARISWSSADRRYTVAGFVKNLLDRRYDTIGFDESILNGSNLTSQGRPRWFGINARATF